MRRLWLVPLLASVPPPASGQLPLPCGPITLTQGVTGPGCASTICGATLVLAWPTNGGPTVCNAWFFMTAGCGCTGGSTNGPALLILGATNPSIPVSIGPPGCVLRANPDIVVPFGAMPGCVGTAYASISFPPDPSLIGVTVFAQGLVLWQTCWIPPLPNTTQPPVLSNGLAITIS